ncbi:uncharacterized protein LOC126833082 isoform X2 [Adelges cooleyi]|uniref:uncharacterized protein LOC126833082 isoform X2 n=1 Tax=Adelges cooleyi TaxID=133065 RepID=UPI00218080CB|nr:uncharacterized protein LOC126833082 isoform X2 [Adelges cooleyi]
MSRSCAVCKFTFASRSNMLRHQRQFNHYSVGPHQPGSIRQTPGEVHVDLTVDDDDDESTNSINSEPTTASQHAGPGQIHVDDEVWIDLTTEENSEADNCSSNIGQTARLTRSQYIYLSERVPATVDSIDYGSDENIEYIDVWPPSPTHHTGTAAAADTAIRTGGAMPMDGSNKKSRTLETTPPQVNEIPNDQITSTIFSSVHITCDGQIIKKEVDILGDCIAQSTIEFENNLPEESWNSCLITENCRHKESLENTNSIVEPGTVPEIKIEKDEEEDSFNTPTYSCSTVQNTPIRIIDANTNNVTKTYNEQDVKVEVDFLGKWKFVSTIEVENQLPLSLHSTSFNKDEVQSFVCNLCHDSFTSKKRIIHHIQKFHKTNCKTTKKISRNKFSAGTKYKDIIFKKKRNSCNINIKRQPVKNVHMIVSKLKEVKNKTPLFMCNLCQKTFNT